MSTSTNRSRGVLTLRTVNVDVVSISYIVSESVTISTAISTAISKTRTETRTETRSNSTVSRST